MSLPPEFFHLIFLHQRGNIISHIETHRRLNLILSLCRKSNLTRLERFYSLYSLSSEIIFLVSSRSLVFHVSFIFVKMGKSHFSICISQMFMFETSYTMIFFILMNRSVYNWFHTRRCYSNWVEIIKRFNSSPCRLGGITLVAYWYHQPIL